MRSREEIACDLLGVAGLDEGGFTVCPGEHLHSHKNGKRDFRVCLDGAATGYCFHSSCTDVVEAFNKELRRRIWIEEQGGKPSQAALNTGAMEPAPVRPADKRTFDYDKLKRAARSDVRVTHGWLKERSPVDVTKIDAMGFINSVFDLDDYVLIFTSFRSQGQYMAWSGRGVYRLADEPGVKAKRATMPRGGKDGVWYLSNPVDGKWHPNPRAPLVKGEVPLSRRSMESVTAWRHMVLECDHKEKACPCKACNGRDNPDIHQLWLNYLVQLRMPIVAIYTSAGKSVHALVRINAESKEHWDRFRALTKPIMELHGADPAAMTAVRLTRLPGCMRDGRLQELLYLNPDPDPEGKPIMSGGNICAGSEEA